ncbi:MAG: DNA-binding transcriptional LysR family regulator [Parasphingorhabdus sp.]|jgi:DNA-binding transcriptional LysR family regulator
MSVRRFRTLLAIAELGTFVDAARQIHLTPAAVSQQMKSLEDELGITLFDRSKRPPILNPAAYALVPKAKAMVKSYDELVPGLNAGVNQTETLSIGAVPTTMTGLMPRALKAMRDADVNLHIRLYPGLSEDLYQQVDRGLMDAAIISQPANILSHMHWWPFAEEPFVLLASEDLLSDDPAELLASQPFIRFTRRAWVGRMIDDWLIKTKANVREVMELDTLESIAVMVWNNLGVSIIPQSCCESPQTLPLKRIPLTHVSPRILGLLFRRETSRYQPIRLLNAELVRLVDPLN